MDGDEAGHAGALLVLATHEVAGALGGGKADVDERRGLHLAVEHREAVAEEEQVALGEAVSDLSLVDVLVALVRDEHHHDVAAAGGLGGRHDLQAVRLGLRDRIAAVAKADDNVDAAVLQVAGMGVTCEP